MSDKPYWMEQYEDWLKNAADDADVTAELQAMQDNPEAVESAFGKDLSFGTGGLRGIIGAGMDRLNRYTVARASQGVAGYIKERFPECDRKAAVSYDSRNKSREFAETAAGVLAANGIDVWIYPELMPTPCLSFAVRYLHCAMGVMITASHNPAEYNGYKVYGSDGGQITLEAASEIQDRIGKTDIFHGVESLPFQEGLASDRIRYISPEVYTVYVESVKKLSLEGENTNIHRDLKIIYSPLNGTGLKPVLRVLKEMGYADITVVKEQEKPDGTFPTCRVPNPELPEAMALGIAYAERSGADLFFATDPDCDRIGVAVREENGTYRILTGNETGILLFDYICSRRAEAGTMPENPVLVKTIVTTDMAEKIAEHYRVSVVNVLTGFKYIGEQIGKLESERRENDYIFGFEESCGYLSGTHARDKDAVNGALLVCEMASYYKGQGLSLPIRLEELYKEYGYYISKLKSYEFKGLQGQADMEKVMEKLRGSVKEIAGLKVVSRTDYLKEETGLPKSDVLKFVLEGGCTLTVRPSGTEPKLKAYILACGVDKLAVTSKIQKIQIGVAEEWVKL